MKAQIMTRGGWFNLDDVELGDEQCIDCDAQAAKATFIGYGDDGEELYWAQCRGCAGETACCNRDAARRSDMEMDYYAGYE